MQFMCMKSRFINKRYVLEYRRNTSSQNTALFGFEYRIIDGNLSVESVNMFCYLNEIYPTMTFQAGICNTFGL